MRVVLLAWFDLQEESFSYKEAQFNTFCYTFQLKYVFWLEENVSRAVGQNSLTPYGEHKTH